MSPRVVVDGFPLCVRSAGVATYTAELLTALAPLVDDERIDVLCPRLPSAAGALLALPSSLRVQRSLLYPLAIEHPFPALSGILSLETITGDTDVFHSTAYALPTRRSCRTVCTVHDLALLRYPHLGTRRMQQLVRRVADTLDRVDRIIAVSAATRDDLIELCGAPADRIAVVHNGVSARFSPEAGGPTLGFPYALHVGTIEPRKNLSALLRAFAALTKRDRDLPHRLVLAGEKGWGEERLDVLATDLGISERVHFLGNVGGDRLPALYAGADALVFPSLYEGFGLPAVEAMASGAPVICSNRAALPEIVGTAALLIDPSDEASIEAALRQVLTDADLRQRMRSDGLARAQAFSWTKCARETLAVYRSLY